MRTSVDRRVFCISYLRLQVHFLTGNLSIPITTKQSTLSQIIPKNLSNMYSSASSRVRMNRMQRALAAWTDVQHESYDYEIPTFARRELDVRRRDNSEWDEKEMESSDLPSSPTTSSEESSQSTSQDLTLGTQSNYRGRSLHNRILPDSPLSWKDETSRLPTLKWCNDNRNAIEKLHSSKTETKVFSHQCCGCDKWFKHCMFSRSRNQNKFCHWCRIGSDTMKTEDDFTIHQHIHCNGLRESICGTFKMDLEYIPNDATRGFRKRRIESKDFSEPGVQVRKRVLTQKARENMNLDQT